LHHNSDINNFYSQQEKAGSHLRRNPHKHQRHTWKETLRTEINFPACKEYATSCRKSLTVAAAPV
jgi:hypothetical protein